MTPVKIGVATASRGVGHMRAAASLIREVEPFPHTWHWVFGRPIPDAQNEVTALALSDPDTTHVFYWEDDMLLPPGVLAAMLAADAPVVTVQYPLRSGQPAVVRQPPDTVLLTGMGCLLVRRDVFAQIASPPFQVEQPAWGIEGGGWRQSDRIEWYGGHDGFFSRECLRQGIRVMLLDGFECGHLETLKLAPRQVRTNVGMDVEICHGGAGLPYRPEARKVGEMAEKVFIKSPSGHVIDMDPDDANFKLFVEQNGWTVVNKTEATVALKRQEKANEATLAGFGKPDD
jgi:hypothetical protein